mmetsp:Transcript_62827/g.172252  ORF Transcript_62827/g.172252 Transcript_62827/m.172252 type:complete len:391 (+) Transcript_62827:162-1334(+)
MMAFRLARPLARSSTLLRPASSLMSSAAAAPTTEGFNLSDGTYESVQNYYGKVLGSSNDLKTSACTTISRPSPSIMSALNQVPQPITDKFYGCGTPLPTSIDGLDVLDLGSGSGRDCYLAAAMVGPTGSVTGVDMTQEQLDTATEHVTDFTKAMGYPKENLRFVKGMIEFLGDAGVAPNSIDLAISNCVINLSPNKEKVLQGVYDSLREGGEFYFSDVYCDRRLPQAVREHDVMLGECLGGALYVEDFRRICAKVGFLDVRELTRETITVNDPELEALCGQAEFVSITYRCFKLKEMETLCEDYGQVAYYKGTIADHPHTYKLDDHHIFEKNRPMLVCGNTAAMCGQSWLAPHFEVVGDMNTHYGLFDCAPAGPSASLDKGDAPAAAGCC